MGLSRGLYNVLVHGFAFMALFTAFQTSGGFQTTVLKDIMGDAQLGTESLAIIYAVFAIGNFVSPIVVQKLGARPCMVLGGVGYALFIGSILTLNSALILSASALLGLSAAIIWTAQGNYITDNTTPANRSQYTGVFWSQLQSSLLIGNTMLYLIVHGGDTVPRETALRFYRILLGVAGGGTLLFLLARKPPPKPQEEGDNAINSSKEESSKSVWEIIKSTFSVLVDRDMLLLSVSIMYSGASLTYWSGVYPTILGDAFQPKDIGISGIVVGCAEIAGGISLSRLGKTAASSWVVMIGLLSHAVAYFLIYFNYRSNAIDPTLWVGLVISFLLGYGDSAFNNALYTILGTLYNQRSSEAFALFKFFQSGMAGIAFAYSGHLALQWQLIILALLLLAGSYMFVLVDRTHSQQRRQGYHAISSTTTTTTTTASSS